MTNERSQLNSTHGMCTETIQFNIFTVRSQKTSQYWFGLDFFSIMRICLGKRLSETI